MLGGTYFYKCIDTSNSSDTIFRYQYLEINNEKFGPNKHPIFVTLKPDYIAFYFDYMSVREIFRIELFFSDLQYNNSLAEQLIRYFNDEIDLFKTINEESNICLNICKNKFISDNKFIYLQELNGNNPNLLLFRKIFLHFLFDLIHSHVFRNCNNFINTVKIFGNNYFLKSLIAKCNYNYYSRIGNYTYFLEAENRWIDLIADENNNHYIVKRNKWFNDAENELKEILFNEENKKNRIEIIKKINQGGKESELIKSLQIQKDRIYNFFLSRYSSWSIEVFIFNYHKNFTKYLLILLLIAIFILQIFALKFNIWIIILNIMICTALIKMLRHIFLMHRFTMLKFSVSYPKMTASIFALWLGFVPICDEMLKLSLNMSQYKFNFFLTSTIIFIGILLSFYIGIIDKVKNSYRKACALLFNGISTSLLIGLFTMYFVSDYIFKYPNEFLPNVESTRELQIFETINFNLKFKDCHSNYCQVFNSDLNKIDSISYNYLFLNNLIESNSIYSDYKFVYFNKVNFETKLIDLRSEIINEHNHALKIIQVPVVSEIRFGKTKIYIFPKLLIIYSIITFYIGIFLQLTFTGNKYKEKF